jgi:hypothetical protein
VSFFDDDEPPTRATRPRRPAGSRPSGPTTRTRARTAAGPPGDQQQLMVRRAVALGVGALVLILLVVGVKGCLNSRTNNALKDYNRNVSSIVADSNVQVSKSLFALLDRGQATAPLDLQQQVNQVRVSADEDVKRTQALDVPGDMHDAQYDLLEVLTLRSGAVQRIADELPNLSGNQSQDAANRIAGQMSAFLASDVVYSQRVIPYLTEALANHGITGQPITPSRSLPDTQWLDAGFVRKQLTGKGAGSSSTGAATTCPSTCGHGLLDVSVGTTTPVTLQPGVTNRITSSTNPVFNVHLANQGQNDEFDVGVKVTVAQGTGAPISVTKRIDQTVHGTNQTVQVPLGRSAPAGPVTVTVSVLKVPGEVNLTNNTLKYTVIFG